MRNKYAKVSDPNSFVTNPGSQDKILYSPIVNPDGTVTLEESGKENIKEKINAQLPVTDMAWIVKQIALGNTSVLAQKTPIYGDFTQMPRSYAEVLQLYIDGQRAFDTLSADIRAKFDNDFMQWFAQAGTESWNEKMNLLKPDPEDPAAVPPPEE